MKYSKSQLVSQTKNHEEVDTRMIFHVFKQKADAVVCSNTRMFLVKLMRSR